MCINICIFIQEVHENIDNSSPHTEEHNPHAHQHHTQRTLTHNTEHHGCRKGHHGAALCTVSATLNTGLKQFLIFT